MRATLALCFGFGCQGHSRRGPMLTRVIALICCVCFCSTGRADLINPNFNASFLPNDNLDWESDESLLGLGVWAQTAGNLLAQPSAELSLFGSNGTVTL